MLKKVFVLGLLAIALILGAVAQPVAAAEFTPTTASWEEIQNQANAISQQAAAIVSEAQAIQNYAEQIKSNENNPAVNEWASEIIALASQTEEDAANIMVTANDINTRIDNSEGTTLTLADDIGIMADRIGEMADRILWTELQIGVMADRIVESEYLISNSSLSLAQMIQNSNSNIATNANAIQTEANTIQNLLP